MGKNNSILIGMGIMIIIRISSFILLSMKLDVVLILIELIGIPLILYLSCSKYDKHYICMLSIGMILVCIIMTATELLFLFPSRYITGSYRGILANMFGFTYLGVVFLDWVYIILSNLTILVCVKNKEIELYS